ncbi:type IV toxin-antitoxin system AbiEi family antitoxin domain-containing protein [Nocardioides terrisoli]|uniref:type IV toxin-antitoxin system AbiEi family antitoxin domain-containing protein n=1 Tax=Nocardioides terrisoli TaxID=3388267 RepID=UPI00287BA967|nr:type IV toxin-antitoxin system AbiEi family antitoxin domain-containing protein [Nocardioides marmorisolisilvae]
MHSDVPYTPFTLAEARRLGITDRRLRDAVRNGLVRRVLRGVYVAADATDTVELRVRAAALVVSPQSVVCDRTAAWLHDVNVFGYADTAVLPPVETCVLRGHAPSNRSGVDGRTRDLRSEDLAQILGVWVTTPLRTALDLGCALGRHRALGALDGFVRVHGITREQMERQLPRYFRRRGVVQLRGLVALADGRSESMRESWIRLDIHDAGLPVPELQYWIEIDGVPTYRLDLAYPKHRVAVEYDGEEFHRRTEEQKARDRTRRKWLREHGWTVIVVDKDGVSGPDPDAWLSELRAALRPRTRRLRWTRIPD